LRNGSQSPGRMQVLCELSAGAKSRMERLWWSLSVRRCF